MSACASYCNLAYFSCQQYSKRTNLRLGNAALGNRDVPRLQNASCAQCGSVVGILETYTKSVRLFKWQLRCRTLHPVQAPTATECLAAALMATMSRSGSAKVMVLPISAGELPSAREEALHLWILNSNITYASTEAAGQVRTAIKLYYRVMDRSEADKLLDPVASDIQDLALAEEALKDTISRLELSNQLLPEEQRRHQHWKVGLLDRYEKDIS